MSEIEARDVIATWLYDEPHGGLMTEATLEQADILLSALSQKGFVIEKKGDVVFSGPRQPHLTLDVLINSDSGFLVAQCLQKDIGAQGQTLDRLLVRLCCTIAAEAVIAHELGEEPFAAIDPAPREFWIKAGKCEPEKNQAPLLPTSTTRG